MVYDLHKKSFVAAVLAFASIAAQAGTGFRDVYVENQKKLDAPAPTADECLTKATDFYQVDPDLVRAIMVVEGGKDGMKNRNSNGTYDYGRMQVNTIWLSHPAMRKIRATRLQNDACTNIFVGTWILATEISASPRNLWRAVGNYHSRTRRYHDRYMKKVRGAYNRIKARSQLVSR